ncbi:unnamed protein product [Arabidopsis halleri]
MDSAPLSLSLFVNRISELLCSSSMAEEMEKNIINDYSVQQSPGFHNFFTATKLTPPLFWIFPHKRYSRLCILSRIFAAHGNRGGIVLII